MNRTQRVAIGTTSIVLVFLCTLIGLWMLSDAEASYSFAVRFVFRFFLIVTPGIVTLTVLHLLKANP